MVMMFAKPKDGINLSNGHTTKIPTMIMMAIVIYLKIRSQSHLFDLSMIAGPFHNPHRDAGPFSSRAGVFRVWGRLRRGRATATC